jgi:hypothetical protein
MAALALCGVVAAGDGLAQQIRIEVLSSRPTLVTGGDALVRITGAAAAPTVSVDGANVSAAFTGDAANGFVGLVTGLKDGPNALVAKAGASEASLTLVNHPINGTLFAGPQQKPFVCENEVHGLAPAKDESCAAPTLVQYFYRANDNSYKPFPVGGARPNDISSTTTLEGKTVPLIVRVEKGVINRAAYVIALLHDPAASPTPTHAARSPGWNGRLIYASRGGVQPGFHMGRFIGSLDDKRAYVGGENNNFHEALINAGYALAASSLNVTGTNTNHVVHAESMAKVKERFIEAYGPPLFTIGMGTSGGAQAQHIVAQNYPGLMDAIMPGRSYPDVITFQTPILDCNLLVNYFKNTKTPWTDAQKTAVSGKLHFGFCLEPSTRFPNLKVDNCDPSVKEYLTNDRKDLRIGVDVRCTYQDNMVNIYGVDPRTGFARSPWDNVGIQYGLQVFNDGLITFDQFADLNASIGGHDINGALVAQRMAGDPEALRIAYSTGQMNMGMGGLAQIPILDIRGYTDGICTVATCPPREPTDVDVHDGYHSLISRDRLIKANGHADNHVRLVAAEIGHRRADSPVSQITVWALGQFDKWVTGITNDRSNRSQAEKLRAHRPAELVDACYASADSKTTNMEVCAKLFPIASDARMVAGAPATNDIMKCQLKPISASDYKRSLTEQQLGRLRQIFAGGVCDYTKPGIGQVPLAGTWLSFPGNGQFRAVAAAQ